MNLHLMGPIQSRSADSTISSREMTGAVMVRNGHTIITCIMTLPEDLQDHNVLMLS